MVQLVVEVPDGLEEGARQAIRQFLLGREVAQREAARQQAILQSDEAFHEEFGWAPFTRACVYCDRVPFSREIRGFGSDPRRPVLMRAAGGILVEQLDWHNMIMKRYLRRIKYTCVDRAEILNCLNDLEWRITQKVRLLSGRAKRPTYECTWYFTSHVNAAFINGELRTDLSTEQMQSLEMLERLLRMA